MTGVEDQAVIGAEPSVSIVTHPTTHGVAEDILVGLGKLGVSARIRDPQATDSAVVIVLSRALVEERGREAALPAIDGRRLVPVAAQRLDGLDVPDALSRLNWIPWNPAERGTTLRMIASACTTDLGDFNAMQSLVARADGWVAGGRSAKEVVNTPTLLRQLQRGASATGFEKLPAHVGEFLAESVKATRSQTWRRRLRVVTWCVLAGVLTWGGWNVVQTLGYQSRRVKLDMVAGVGIDAPFSRVQMVQFAGLAQLQLNHGDQPAPELSRQIIQTFAVPSASSQFHSTPSGMAVNAVAFGSNGDMLMADGGGSLWRTATGDLTMHPVSTGIVKQFFSFTAVPDLSTWAGAGSSEVVVEQRGTRQTLQVAGVEQLAISPDGQALGALTGGSFEVWRLGPVSPTQVRSTPREKFLGAGLMHDQLIQVQRRGRNVTVVDAVTGAVRRVLPVDADDLTAVAVGQGGDVVIQGRDHRLWHSTEAAFRSLGLPVQDVVSALAITPAGQLIYASRGARTHFVDLRSQAQLHDVCTEGSVRTITLSPDGRRLLCDYGATKMIWDLAPLIPGPPSADRPPATSVSASGVQATLHDTSLSVTMPDGSRTVTSLTTQSSTDSLGMRGRPVTLALSPDGRGLTLGSDAGDVVVVDISLQGAVTTAGPHWRSPDGSSVRSLTLAASAIEVSTSTGTWEVAACVGCVSDSARMLAEVRRHLMACYVSGLVDLLGRDVSDQLGVIPCREA